ncbi:hypothetical protein ACCD01_31420, partial [Telluria sp. Tellsp99]
IISRAGADGGGNGTLACLAGLLLGQSGVLFRLTACRLFGLGMFLARPFFSKLAGPFLIRQLLPDGLLRAALLGQLLRARLLGLLDTLLLGQLLRPHLLGLLDTLLFGQLLCPLLLGLPDTLLFG